MSTSYFRSDGWVKTSLGPAIPGAQVYVCSQPANTNSAPPSPLVSIYSDPNGLVPITQPILTDGFGHYDYYVLPGTYTLVIAYNDLIQQVYEDQSIGLAGSAPSSLALEVNGTPNVDQNLLNLIAGSGVTLADNGVGGITITGNGGTTLQTNGTNNTDQALLNLIAGSGVTLSADGSGGVTINSSGGGFSTAGEGGFWSCGLPLNTTLTVEMGSVPPEINAANQVLVWQFVLESSWTLRNVTSYVVGAGASGSLIAFGIWTADGNTKLIDSGPLAAATSNQQITTTFTPVTLSPGTYYFGCGDARTSGPAPTMIAFNAISGQGATSINILNQYTTKIGIAANPVDAEGNLPATLGALTPQSNSSAQSVIAAFFGV